MDEPFDIYTNTVCACGGDVPDWLMFALLALPIALVIADILGAR